MERPVRSRFGGRVTVRYGGAAHGMVRRSRPGEVGHGVSTVRHGKPVKVSRVMPRLVEAGLGQAVKALLVELRRVKPSLVLAVWSKLGWAWRSRPGKEGLGKP